MLHLSWPVWVLVVVVTAFVAGDAYALWRTAETPPEDEGIRPREKRRRNSTLIVTWVARVIAQIAAVLVGVALFKSTQLSDKWLWEIVVFVAVATVPQWPIEKIASLAESVAADLDRRHTSPPGFGNLGAFVGLAERPIFLAALVSGAPELIVAWLVFKGIAGFRVGLETEQLKERRLFQLFLLNSAMSLAGALLGWLVWNLLGLPIHTKLTLVEAIRA